MNQPILIDESVFDEEFIPERLVCREGQIKEIANCLRPIKDGKSARNLYIRGLPGTGKTSVCRSILKQHFSTQSIYVNCWSKRTTHKIMEEILAQMGQVIHGRESSSELVRRYEKLSKKVVVCLDESDQIKELDIFYVLARKGSCLMLISNDPFPLSLADQRIRSSLLLNEIEFKPYAREDILSIIKERIGYAMPTHLVDNRILLLIANSCSGDARVALQTLRMAAKEAETNGLENITVTEIRNALKCSRKYRLSYLLRKLNHHQMIVYEILKRNRSMDSGELFREYRAQSKQPIVDRTYRNQVERMVELGLIRAEGMGRWKKYALA